MIVQNSSRYLSSRQLQLMLHFLRQTLSHCTSLFRIDTSMSGLNNNMQAPLVVYVHSLDWTYVLFNSKIDIWATG